MKNPIKLIQSYVLEKYYISTMYRECSAITDIEIWYYETIVFKFDKELKKIGCIIDTYDSGENPADALVNHNNICLSYLLQENENS